MSSAEVKLTRRVETLTPLTDSFEWNTPVDSDVTSVLLCHHCMTGYGWEVTLQTTSTKLPLVGARTCLFNDIRGRSTGWKCKNKQIIHNWLELNNIERKMKVAKNCVRKNK